MGYISGVMGMNYVISHFMGIPVPGPNATEAELAAFVLPSWMQSLITSILSAGTFFGALIAGDVADYAGRRTTIIAGCGIFIVGIILQTAATEYKLLVAGRAIAGIGVGFESAVVILYMSEIAPRKVRGALVSGYQFCITIGLMVSGVAG
jgi:MFS family permease